MISLSVYIVTSQLLVCLVILCSFTFPVAAILSSTVLSAFRISSYPYLVHFCY